MEKRIEWKDSDKIADIFSAFEDGRPEYPAVCPECGSKSGHIYFHRHDDTNRGGAWAWCDSCHAYGHYSTVIPSWWHNLAVVNEDNLCGADPEELLQLEETIDRHINDALMRYRMSDNVCRYCIRKECETPQISVCPECGQETWMATLDGLCMILQCSNCGLEVVGASFWPPCMLDDLEYTISVKEVAKEQKVKIAKLFGMNVRDVLYVLREDGFIRKTEKLEEIKLLFEELGGLGIEAVCEPDFRTKYPELIGCKHRD